MKLMRHLNIVITILFATISVMCFAEKTIVFYDRGISEPIAGVTVIGKEGLILGCTNQYGKIDVNDKSFPLSISCIGYESSTISEPSDTIYLSAAVYSLPEVEINTAERPIIRVVSYAREYSTGATASDTLQLFSEYMLESFIADGKVKGYSKSDAHAKIAARKCIGRNANKNGLDSIYSPGKNDELAMLSFIDIVSDLPNHTFKETETIKNGATADSIAGRYATEYRIKKANNLYLLQRDLLSNYENHKLSPTIFKLFGLTMDLEEISLTAGYLVNEKGEYYIPDLLYTTATMRVNGRGKMFKYIFKVDQSIMLDTHIEQYPVATEYLTVEEYKELKKDKNRVVNFEIPSIATDLPPAIHQLKQHLE